MQKRKKYHWYANQNAYCSPSPIPYFRKAWHEQWKLNIWDTWQDTSTIIDDVIQIHFQDSSAFTSLFPFTIHSKDMKKTSQWWGTNHSNQNPYPTDPCRPYYLHKWSLELGRCPREGFGCWDQEITHTILIGQLLDLAGLELGIGVGDSKEPVSGKDKLPSYLASGEIKLWSSAIAQPSGGGPAHFYNWKYHNEVFQVVITPWTMFLLSWWEAQPL